MFVEDYKCVVLVLLGKKMVIVDIYFVLLYFLLGDIHIQYGDGRSGEIVFALVKVILI